MFCRNVRNISLKKTCNFLNSFVCRQCALSEANQLTLNAKNSHVKLEEENSKVYEVEFGIIPPWKKNYRHTLLAYIDACIHINELDAAHSVLLAYSPQQLLYRKNNLHLDGKLYTHLMHAWAKKGDFHKINELQTAMEATETSIGAQVFAAKLECLFYQNPIDDNKIKDVVYELEQKGFTLQDIILKSVFKMDEKINVLKVIRKIFPDFFMENNENEKFGYLCKLLNDFKRGNFKTVFPEKSDLPNLQSKAREQLRFELKGFRPVLSIEKSSLDDKTIQSRKKVRHFLETYRSIIQQTFKEERDQLESIDTTYVSILPFLKVLSLTDFTELLIQEIVNIAEISLYDHVKNVSEFKVLGNQIFTLYQAQSRVKCGVVDKISQLYHRYLEYYTNAEISSTYLPVEYWNFLCKEMDKDFILINEDITWTDSIEKMIGNFLMNILIRSLYIDANMLKKNKTAHIVPALYQTNPAPLSFIRPHPVLIKFLTRGSSSTLHVPVNRIPMQIPPVPWVDTLNGGNLLSSNKVMKTLERVSSYQNILEKSSQSLRPYLDTVNLFSAFPWAINKPVLSVMLSLFQNSTGEKVGLPVHPRVFFYHSYKKRKYIDKKSSLKFALKSVIQNYHYAKWRSILLQISLANMLSEGAFWLPHKINYLGRIYNTSRLLSYLGPDLERGLLKFAVGKTLGDKGLDWLKINLVNLTGHKKLKSLKERLEYAEEKLPDIIASADDPLNTNSWWMTTDKPWQVLSFCFEITGALRSGDPKKYISYLPVFQDGTTNMLQHYAGLIGDSQIAQLVNMEPMDTPHDFYNGLLPFIQNSLAQDIKQGYDFAKPLLSSFERKLLKKIVIWAIYGGKEANPVYIIPILKKLGVRQRDLHRVAVYLIRKVTSCARKQFPNIFKVQKWLKQCASVINHHRNAPVEWETPLGLYMCQMYCKIQLDWNKGFLTDDESEEEELEPDDKDVEVKSAKIMEVDKEKQINTFFSNYLQCLEACHMILTALHCHKEGVPFLAVHDSFLTYASSVDQMNKICREQFVKLHREPLLEDLAEQLIKKFGYSDSELLSFEASHDLEKKLLNFNLADIPQRGCFNLDNVLQSTYFFS